VGVRGAQGHGPEERIYAEGVIGADGKRSFVAREVGAEVYDRIPGATCIFYAYYRDWAPIEEPSAISYQCPDPRIAYGVLVFDADAGLTVVSAGAPAQQFDALRKDPAAALERAWRAFLFVPELKGLGRPPLPPTPVMGQAAVDSFYRASYGPGWALVGDAGHYVDPVTGQGINNALRSAELLSEAWAKTRRRASWVQAMAEYQRQRDRETRPMYNMIKFAAQFTPVAETIIETGLNPAAPLMRAIARQPEVARHYIGIFNGATRIRDFFHPVNLAYVMASDLVWHQLPAVQRKLTGRAA
jgi:2-polyprenyl-6-methoxyphenol hydroxylase-like FAD-dependent oxidoreductase